MPRELSYHSMMDRWRRSVSEFFAFVSSIFFSFPSRAGNHPQRITKRKREGEESKGNTVKHDVSSIDNRLI